MGFEQYEIHSVLRRGLKESGFEEPTQVQKKSIPAALEGKNVVCSSGTGTGKTLAFLIPAVQKLLASKWDRTDGLGALVITPTRELALQIFEVLQKIGKYTNLSGGLLIGGRDAEKEKESLASLNIVVGTPGRLLEHFESAWRFSGDVLEVLVIDEADKLLEMGFKQTVERIMEYVRRKRQTLLFSATAEQLARSKKIWDIEAPEFITVRSEEEKGGLEQEVYVVTPSQKFDLLYRVIKNNLKKKILVFLATCKEVAFFHALLLRLRLGAKVLALSGSMSQKKRIEVCRKFSGREAKVLLATDLVARGLDFPGVGVVLQLDAPDTKETYIHRVGRTARNNASGKGVLALLERERGVLKDLEGFKGLGEPKEFRSIRTICDRVHAVMKESPEIYTMAQKYVKTYKASLRTMKKEYTKDAEKDIEEIVAYLGVQEDENVSWSAPAKRKSKMLNTKIRFD